MRNLKPVLKSLFIPALLLFGACTCEKEVVAPPPPPPPPPPVAPLGDVFYEFDRSDLSTAAQDQLKTNATWMSSNAGRNVIVEGHCDERGTNEYNLALGERRAASAKDYMVSLGAEAARLKTVSYGEERPFDPGHDEAAWAQNRRAHFVAE
jgi:peptidoglycan-associated lipoprotein